jgi:hypothetical protein
MKLAKEEEIFFTCPLIVVDHCCGYWFGVLNLWLFSLNQSHLGQPSRFLQSVCTLVIVRRDCVANEYFHVRFKLCTHYTMSFLTLYHTYITSIR